MGIPLGAPEPCEQRVRVPRVKTCLPFSLLNPLREMSLLKTRGGSIVGLLRHAEASIRIKEPCRNGGFRDATFYKWHGRFGGTQVSEAQRLRELESENAKFKKLLAAAHLDMHALKSVLGVKRWPHKPGAKRSANWWASTICPSAAPVALWGSPAAAIAMHLRPTR